MSKDRLNIPKVKTGNQHRISIEEVHNGFIVTNPRSTIPGTIDKFAYTDFLDAINHVLTFFGGTKLESLPPKRHPF